MIVRLVATNPPGRGLLLIGGFRYRFLDRAARRSLDVDYHWGGNLAGKQGELLRLFERRLIPEVRQRLEHEGSVRAATGPEADSPAVRIIDLAFWQHNVPHSRIEIPVEITKIVCLDPVEVRTADGIVYPTVSDADMIESKLIALLVRTFVQHRDLVDLFLFSNSLLPDVGKRLGHKLEVLGVSLQTVADRRRSLEQNRTRHARAIEQVVNEQVDADVAANIRAAGGGATILDAVLEVLERVLG
ncbi:MAG: hypothetical protein JXR37_16375 [Kiritimatiellae bacterium]|nr:hypothetical protein [Kiritimatiellia bacterium]